ncbi:MAG: AAA family ATPase [Ardenticatenaceae bacterium]
MMSLNDNQVQAEESLSLSELLARLSPEGREALVIALGEGLRIHRPWLGVEFLLMGLSKQEGRVLPGFLGEVGIKGGILRGQLRSQVGVAADRGWRRVDVMSLGRQAFELLGQASIGVSEGEEPQLVVTPRMFRVWRVANGLAEQELIGHAHLLVALLQERDSLPVELLLGLAQKGGWSAERVNEWVAQRVEEQQELELAAREAGYVPLWPLSGLLGKFGRDLTAEAQAGKLSPPIGVEELLRRVKRVLIQPEANNPLLIGPPGVGKTAIVEGLACELAFGNAGVAELAGRRIVEIRMNDLVAGTKYRGELEERVSGLLAEVKAAPEVIVFIDEMHTILGRGRQSSSHIGHWLKPALARGEFPCIGATTLAEYRQTIEQDGALNRRFQTIVVEEPTVETCIKILSERYRERITDEAVEAAVRLSARYLPDKRLPDKAIRLLEEAQAYIKVPAFDMEAPMGEPQPLFSEVNADLIRYLLEQKTGIPLTQLAGDEMARIKGIDTALSKRVIGQEDAVQAVAQVVKRARAGLNDPRQPVGVLLFVGPTGVGKTELARALAEFLFHSGDALIRLDMSEYTEKHQVARLIGAPPGYVGYQEEGQLTGQLRQRPHCVVLLDEIEKAHPDVHHLFLQLFDDGRLTDSKGRTANGREAIFIMTSNLGSDLYQEEPLGFGLRPLGSSASLKEKQHNVEQTIKRQFKPEFVNRIDQIVHFKPLSSEEITRIFDLQLAAIQERLAERHQIDLTVTPAAKQHVSKQGYDPQNGARPLARAIDSLIITQLTDLILDGELKRGQNVQVDYNGEELVFEKTP